MNASGSPSLKGFSDIWASAENISHWDIRLAGGGADCQTREPGDDLCRHDARQRPQMKRQGAAYGMAGSPVIANMQRLLENIVRKSANVY
ncbi:MAG: hypothetical protein ACLRMJ_08335 [Alistipes finegoldii]